MLVSLCMIAYNESNALSGLFRDIALQDYPHDKIEVVFVDSMSTDDTKEKMEKFRDADYGFWNVSVVQCVKRNQNISTAFFMRLIAERLLPKSVDLTKIWAEPRIMNFTTALEWRATRCAVAPILSHISTHEMTFTE